MVLIMTGVVDWPPALTLDYIIGHFEKFPISVISPSLPMARALTPQLVLDSPRKVTASGGNAFATKRYADELSPASAVFSEPSALARATI